MQPLKPNAQRRLLRNKKAVSPAISTIILTAVTVVLILVAMNYATNFMTKRMAENEFSANKQFMLTTGLQIDDMAWTIGRTQTSRYTTSYGNIQFQSNALEYTLEVKDDSGWQNVSSVKTGMIMFSIPVNMYSLNNGYFERLSSSNSSFLQEGASASCASVYCIEKLPMSDGSFVRIVAVPTLRMLQSNIGSTNYYKFYLPVLNNGQNLYLSQSVTMTGNNITKVVNDGISAVRLNVTFPNSGLGFNSDFFNFDSDDQINDGLLSKTIQLDKLDSKSDSTSVVEFYMGNVVVAVGKV
ncbi:MAG: archaellin/type IV pilin N-terminal domain-containing protein [Candidatus Bathyarchaeia archaeon]|jgi:hypothetical protein